MRVSWTMRSAPAREVPQQDKANRQELQAHAPPHQLVAAPSAFNVAVDELMSSEVKTPELRIDCGIELKDLTPRFLRILKEFAPYGPGNMRPIFLARNVEVVGTPRIVGKDHLRFKVRQNACVLDGIGFGLGSMIGEVRNNGRALDLVFSVDEHEWLAPGSNPHSGGNEVFPQLKIKDLKQHKEDH